MGDGRAAVVRACNALVPSDWGDERFALIVNGSYSPGSGTTCAYLPAAALYYAGCRDARLVNFEAPEDGLVFHVSQGIHALVFGLGGDWSSCAPWYVPWERGAWPSQGDIAFITNGPALSEHVEVCDDAAAWTAWAAGQTNALGNQCARHVSRVVDERADGVYLSGPDGSGTYRRLHGWVSADLVSFTAEPSGPAAGGGGVLPLVAASAVALALMHFGKG